MVLEASAITAAGLCARAADVMPSAAIATAVFQVVAIEVSPVCEARRRLGGPAVVLPCVRLDGLWRNARYA
jgi:hypothetical protein